VTSCLTRAGRREPASDFEFAMALFVRGHQQMSTALFLCMNFYARLSARACMSQHNPRGSARHCFRNGQGLWRCERCAHEARAVGCKRSESRFEQAWNPRIQPGWLQSCRGHREVFFATNRKMRHIQADKFRGNGVMMSLAGFGSPSVKVMHSNSSPYGWLIKSLGSWLPNSV